MRKPIDQEGQQFKKAKHYFI